MTDEWSPVVVLIAKLLLLIPLGVVLWVVGSFFWAALKNDVED